MSDTIYLGGAKFCPTDYLGGCEKGQSVKILIFLEENTLRHWKRAHANHEKEDQTIIF